MWKGEYTSSSSSLKSQGGRVSVRYHHLRNNWTSEYTSSSSSLRNQGGRVSVRHHQHHYLKNQGGRVSIRHHQHHYLKNQGGACGRRSVSILFRLSFPPFTHSFVHLYILLFTHSSIHPFICSFIGTWHCDYACGPQAPAGDC